MNSVKGSLWPHASGAELNPIETHINKFAFRALYIAAHNLTPSQRKKQVQFAPSQGKQQVVTFRALKVHSQSKLSR